MYKQCKMIVSIFAIVLLACPSVLFAHAKMSASVPKDGAKVTRGLDKVAVSFSKPMRPTVIRLLKLPSKKVFPITSALPKTFVTEAEVGFAPLEQGKYEVHWVALARDGHVMRGKFSFLVLDK